VGDGHVRRGGLEDLLQAEAAAEAAGAARARPQAHTGDPQREVHLHRLDRDVHAVRDVGLDGVDAVLVRPRPAAGGHRWRRTAGPSRIAAPKAGDQGVPEFAPALAGQGADQRARIVSAMRLMVAVRQLWAPAGAG
jgi:hypothetical protein